MKVSPDRDRRVRDIGPMFSYQHLPPDLKGMSVHFHDLAASLIHELPDSEELVVGLRKLLEAKDCFVRAKQAAKRETE